MDEDRQRLATLGLAADAEPLGRGTEGTVYRLGGGRVAKVWLDRPADALRPLAEFLGELTGARLPFATPEIERIETADGRAVTVERELTGTPMSEALAAGALPVESAIDRSVDVLAALRGTAAGPAAVRLGVLGGADPLSAPGTAWGDGLAALLKQRLARFGDQLAVAVSDLEQKVAGLTAWLGRLPAAPSQVVHGDLCPPNVLLDGAGRPSAVLDWGLLTGRGDPALDAGTFAGFFDMYGREARAHDDAMVRRIRRRFGYSANDLLRYRAWYALVGSNLYEPSGRDAHFAWCAATLNRADVTAALRGR